MFGHGNHGVWSTVYSRNKWTYQWFHLAIQEHGRANTVIKQTHFKGGGGGKFQGGTYYHFRGHPTSLLNFLRTTNSFYGGIDRGK